VVTATGRLSSNEPNLQNIPVRTELGREIRSAFVPGTPGWRLLAADYSQIELRVLAHFSGDEALRTAFARDQDIHTRVASEVFGVAADQVTSDMRRKAKAVNFGVIYGQSPFGLAKSINVSQDEAAAFIQAYFARYPGVIEFIEKTLEDCRQTGYVKTILGRRRRITGIREKERRGDAYQRSLPERTAINTVIQGSAADLIKLAMLGIYRRLERECRAARMLLQIHDELIFESPPDEIILLGRLVEGEMASVHELSIPLRVDVKVGENWGALESL
jgi:DNA polymerase-1